MLNMASQFNMTLLMMVSFFFLCCAMSRKFFNEQRSNGLVVKALDSQSRVPRFKTNGWFQGQLSFSSFQSQSTEYQELLGTEW